MVFRGEPNVASVGGFARPCAVGVGIVRGDEVVLGLCEGMRRRRDGLRDVGSGTEAVRERGSVAGSTGVREGYKGD